MTDKASPGMRTAEKYFSLIPQTIISVCFGIIVIMTITLAFLRYVFNTSIDGGNELMEHLFIYTTAVGAAVAISKKEHIRITYVLDKLPPLPRRIVEGAGYLLIGLLNGFMLVHSVSWIQGVGGNESPILRIPVWVVQIIVPVSCCLSMLYCVYLIILLFLNKEIKE